MKKFFTEQERISFLISKASDKTKPTQRSSVIALLSEAIERTTNLSDTEAKTYHLIHIAKTYCDLDLKDQSVEVLEQALNIVENCEDDILRASNLNDIGYQYARLDQTRKGFELLETALGIAASLEDVDARDLTLCDIASKYGYLGRIDIALEIARQVQDEDRVIYRILAPLQIEQSEFFSTGDSIDS